MFATFFVILWDGEQGLFIGKTFSQHLRISKESWLKRTAIKKEKRKIQNNNNGVMVSWDILAFSSVTLNMEDRTCKLQWRAVFQFHVKKWSFGQRLI